MGGRTLNHRVQKGVIAEVGGQYVGPTQDRLLALAKAVGVDIFAHLDFWIAVAFLAFLQLTASVLNLMPIPGVDGGNALHPWLSPQWRRGYDMLAPYGMLLLFALLWNDRIGGWFFTGVFWLGDRLGLPRELYSLGFDMIRFWQV